MVVPISESKDMTEPELMRRGAIRSNNAKQIQRIETCSDNGDEGRNADCRELLGHSEEEETAGGKV